MGGAVSQELEKGLLSFSNDYVFKNFLKEATFWVDQSNLFQRTTENCESLLTWILVPQQATGLADKDI